MSTSGTDPEIAAAGQDAEQADDAFDLNLAFREIERSHKNVVMALVYTWVLGANLLQLNNDALAERVRTPAETKIYQSFASSLTAVGHFFAPRIQNLNPDDLARYGLERDRLLV
jgi:hypothetical protein